MELHVGRGTTRGALTVFPIWGGGDDRRGYSTDVATLSVSEVAGGPSVPVLVATNTGTKPLLLLEGHLFEGGWQHRMATRSVLMDPTRQTLIDVACVEQSRWAGGRDQSTAGRRATPFVRSGANASHDAQGEIWRRVQSYEDRAVGVASGSITGFLDSARPEISRLVAGLKALPGQTGVAIAIAGRMLMAEVFDHPRTLREQFDSIIAAAALDALGQEEVATPSQSARQLIESFEDIALSQAATAGLGAHLAARTNRINITALGWRGRLLHTRMINLRHPLLMGTS